MADSDTTQQVDVKKLVIEAIIADDRKEALARLEALAKRRAEAKRKAKSFLTTTQWTSAILFIAASLVGF